MLNAVQLGAIKPHVLGRYTNAECAIPKSFRSENCVFVNFPFPYVNKALKMDLIGTYLTFNRHRTTNPYANPDADASGSTK